MPLRMVSATLAALTLASLLFAFNQRARVQQLESELAAARARTCPPCASPSANLASLLSLAASAKKRPPPAAVSPAPTARDDDDDEPDRDFDQLSGDEQRSMFEIVDKLKSGSGKRLDDIVRELRLDGAHERQLRERIDRMNQQVLAAADQLVAATSEKQPSAMALIDPLADGLAAISRADAEFRAGLDDDQRAALKKNDFNLASQIDASGLFTRMLAFAAASKSSN